MPHYTNDGVFLRSNRGDWNPAPATAEEQARQQRRAEAMCAARAWYEDALAHAFAVGLSDIAALVTPTTPVFNADDSIDRGWSVYVRFDGVAPASPTEGEYAGTIPGADVPGLRQVEACVEAWLAGCE